MFIEWVHITVCAYMDSILVDFSVLYLVSKTSEKSGISSPLLINTQNANVQLSMG